MNLTRREVLTIKRSECPIEIVLCIVVDGPVSIELSANYLSADIQRMLANRQIQFVSILVAVLYRSLWRVGTPLAGYIVNCNIGRRGL